MEGNAIRLRQPSRSPRKPVLAGRQFTGYQALETEINRIRMTAPLDTPMWPGDSDDANLLNAWMSTSYKVQREAEQHGAPEFCSICWNPEVVGEDKRQVWVHFEDGFSLACSYRLASNGIGREASSGNGELHHLQEIRWTARQAIAPLMIAHKSEHIALGGVCEITGQALCVPDADVHHEGLTFDQLLFAFLREMLAEAGIGPSRIGIRRLDDAGNRTFEDDLLTARWVAYHEQHAQLMVLTRQAHLALHSERGKDLTPPWADLLAIEDRAAAMAA